ncbi:MAG: PIN domain-containing protein [Phycisphaerae bacterium]|nr:PIN domain-containing protein [Phycisphaerae bacterium]
MILNLIRFIFAGLVALVGLAYQTGHGVNFQAKPYFMLVAGIVLAFMVITIDLMFRRKNLSAISGLFLGLLVGIVLSLVLGALVDQISKVFLDVRELREYRTLIRGGKLLIGLSACYLSISLILQTKDDFRFIIPYVEFSRATRGPRPYILDTSAIIDGRIADIAVTGILESQLIVPRFVINELQTVADSADRLRRARGRRGLDVLQKLQAMPKLELRIWDGTLVDNAKFQGVDQKLVALAAQENSRVVTSDYNLNKVATLHGVTVVNLNDLANAVRAVVLPGEQMRVRVIKPGESPGQGVGYLEDGTMVVIENARDKIGSDIDILITNSVHTSAGRMIFARCTTEASGVNHVGNHGRASA